MAQTIRLKRSAVAAKAPLTTDLALGELAINTYDGKMYFKKNVSGTDSIITLANDDEVVKLTGTQSIAGLKTFTNNLTINAGTGQTSLSVGPLSGNRWSGFLYDHSTSAGNVLANEGIFNSLILNRFVSTTSAKGNIYFWTAAAATNGGGDIVFAADPSTNTPRAGIYGSIQNLKVPTTDYEAANKKYVDDQDALKANDSAVVKLTGDQTIGGNKTFSGAGTTLSLDNPNVIFGTNTFVNIQTQATVRDFNINGLGTTSHRYINFWTPSTNTNGGIIRFGTDASGNLQATPKGAIQNLGTPVNNNDAANKQYVDDQVATKANTSHTHAAGDITSGTISTARLGSGTADNTTFLRGDNTWAVPSGGGGAPTSAEYLVKTADATLSAERVVGDSTSITANWTTGGAVSFERAALTGDVTASANSNATTLANTTVTPGSYTAANITVDSKGRLTAASSNTIPTVNDGTLTLNVSGTGLSGSQTFTANQGTNTTFTVTSNATSNNTASTLVARDASGNFSAGTVSATVVSASNGFQVGSGAINAQTTGYSLVTTDNGKIITINSASPVTLTVGTSVGTVGFSCTLIQLGAGQVTISGSGTALNSFAGLKLAGQNAAATIICYATNTFNVAGGLTE